MNKGNKVFLTIIIVITMVVAIAAVSYAYFTAQINKSAGVDVNITADGNAKIYFEYGDDLNLAATEPGKNGELKFSVEITADSKATAKAIYSIAWNITENTFVYDSNSIEKTAELTYDLYYSYDDKTWMTYKNNQDCTQMKGQNIVAQNLVIEAEKNQTNKIYWKLVVNYLSLDKDQSYNQNKSFQSTLSITDIK